MDIKKRDLILISIVAVSTFYIFGIFTSVLDPSLTLHPQTCKEVDEYVSGIDNYGNEIIEHRCVKFRSALDEQKYYYNVGVKKRNYYWLALNTLFTSIIVILISPLIYNTRDGLKKVLAGSYLWVTPFVFVVGIMGSIILHVILPPPSRYLPFLTQIIKNWEEDIVEGIKNEDIHISNDGKIID